MSESSRSSECWVCLGQTLGFPEVGCACGIHRICVGCLTKFRVETRVSNTKFLCVCRRSLDPVYESFSRSPHLPPPAQQPPQTENYSMLVIPDVRLGALRTVIAAFVVTLWMRANVWESVLWALRWADRPQSSRCVWLYEVLPNGDQHIICNVRACAVEYAVTALLGVVAAHAIVGLFRLVSRCPRLSPADYPILIAHGFVVDQLLLWMAPDLRLALCRSDVACLLCVFAATALSITALDSFVPRVHISRGLDNAAFLAAIASVMHVAYSAGSSYVTGDIGVFLRGYLFFASSVTAGDVFYDALMRGTPTWRSFWGCLWLAETSEICIILPQIGREFLGNGTYGLAVLAVVYSVIKLVNYKVFGIP